MVQAYEDLVSAQFRKVLAEFFCVIHKLSVADLRLRVNGGEKKKRGQMLDALALSTEGIRHGFAKTL